MSVLVIAEAGVNHNGDMERAKEMVSTAAKAGADIVKFQTFKADKLAVKHAQKAQYQQELTGSDESQYSMLKRLELPYDAHQELIECCNQHNIEFLSTAFESSSLDFLVNHCHLKRLKIPSGEITNGPFLLEHAKHDLNLILSTGMSSLKEVREALSVLAWGFLTPNKSIKNLQDCLELLKTDEALEVLQNKVTILHCTSQYPAPPESVNLNAITTLSESFNIPVGYSDHTLGNTASIGAVALGATTIEKHFTLDKNLEGPDHKASLSPDELTSLVKDLRLISTMRGDGNKLIQDCEQEVRSVIRKGIVAATNIPKGTNFTTDSLTTLRPDNGVSPMNYWGLMKSVASKDYKPGDTIDLKDLNA
ncbi:N-acetylneuraminate synthase [Kiloniella litopenaei]|uniref:N-acetylneuraminate synthase n=1 Tax=Kiloniella litopenaei TaxID=1549748 RepID=UPI003BA92E37